LSTKTTESIFNEFTGKEGEKGFYKTIVPVDLVRYGNENLISRSQAKRLMSRLERFQTVVLDFKDIDMIGRAFADEVFRVFANNHPKTIILTTNDNVKIRRLIDEIRRSDAFQESLINQ
jgi:uncharacterized protein (DUF1330 family)